MDLTNVFVTVGTTQFDLLIKTITQVECIRALKRRGCKQLRLQVGSGTYLPSEQQIDGVQINAYRFKNFIRGDMEWANFVISHAGSGSCLEALELEKPILVVVNTDLMDNHQLEVATKLKEEGFLHYTTCADLLKTLCNLNLNNLKVYPKRDPLEFTNAIDRIMGFM